MQRLMAAQLREQQEIKQLDGDLQAILERIELVVRIHDSCRVTMADRTESDFLYLTDMRYMLHLSMANKALREAQKYISRMLCDCSPQELRDKLFTVFCNVRTGVWMLAEADRLEPNCNKTNRFWEILQPLTISPTLADAENVFRCVTQLYEQSERNIPVDPATLSRPLPAVPQRVHAADAPVPSPMDVDEPVPSPMDVDEPVLSSMDVDAVIKSLSRTIETLSRTLKTLSRQTAAAPPVEPRSSSRGALPENVPPHRMAATNRKSANATFLQRRSARGAAFEADDDEQDAQEFAGKRRSS